MEIAQRAPFYDRSIRHGNITTALALEVYLSQSPAVDVTGDQTCDRNLVHELAIVWEKLLILASALQIRDWLSVTTQDRTGGLMPCAVIATKEFRPWKMQRSHPSTPRTPRLLGTSVCCASLDDTNASMDRCRLDFYLPSVV